MRARQWRHVAAMLAFLGPGIITGAAGDDAGGIATYASIGAQYGYSLLWVMGPITLALIVVQVQVARMGVVTGKGFAELIREQFGVRWTAMAMLVLLVANGTVTIAEFAGIAAATDIFDSRLVGPVVLVSAVLAWLIVVRGSYTVAEKIFIALSLALLTYVGAAFLAHPDWREVAVSLVTPRMQLDSGYLTTFVALVGTTITPYMLFYLQSSLSDKGVRLDEYPAERTDVILGSLLTTVVALFIIVCTAATLHREGILIDTADDAARALEPLAGPYARVLFGWERGVSSSWSQAPIFNGLYTALIAMGAAFVLIPGLPLIQVIIATQFLNGLLLPIVLIFVLRLVNNSDIMGEHTNSPLMNVLSYATTGILLVLTVALLTFSVIGAG
jgi:Mn2+/Fe2+ NRAMP family transporter